MWHCLPWKNKRESFYCGWKYGNGRISWDKEGEMGLKELMFGEGARIQGYLKGSKEAYCSWNFLKYMKVIIKKFPNNWGVPTGYLLPPNKASITRTGLHQIELLYKRFSRKLPYNPGCCQNIRLFFKHWQQVPLLKTTPTQFIEYGEGGFIPT